MHSEERIYPFPTISIRLRSGHLRFAFCTLHFALSNVNYQLSIVIFAVIDNGKEENNLQRAGEYDIISPSYQMKDRAL